MHKGRAIKSGPFPLSLLGTLHSQRMNDLFVARLRTKLVLRLRLSIQQSFAMSGQKMTQSSRDQGARAFLKPGSERN